MSQPRRHADGAGSVYTANDKPCNHILHFLSPEFKHGRVQIYQQCMRMGKLFLMT